MQFKDYDTRRLLRRTVRGGRYTPRPGAELLIERINTLPEHELQNRQIAAEKALLNLGITFNVYSNEAQTEKIFPFDIIPRIIQAQEWQRMELGLKQRIHALNLFIHDVYNDQKIIRDGVIPAELVFSADGYRKACIGLQPPGGVWCHITGTDLVRHADGRVLRAGRQPALPVRGLLCPREPDDHETHPADGLRCLSCSAGHRISEPAARYAPRRRPRPGSVHRWSRSGRRGSTTRPTSSTVSWLSRWVPSWSKGGPDRSSQRGSCCRRPRGWSGSTSSTGGSMTTSWTRLLSVPIRCLACPG